MRMRELHRHLAAKLLVDRQIHDPETTPTQNPLDSIAPDPLSVGQVRRMHFLPTRMGAGALPPS